MAGQVITPKQLMMQWAVLPNKFEVNIFNFETIMGDAAKHIFKQSFYLRRFNSASSFAWQPRRDKKRHPLLEETGNLKNSIVWKHFKGTGNKRGVSIYTDPCYEPCQAGNRAAISGLFCVPQTSLYAA